VDPLHTLGLALGTSFAAGLNLYATLLTAGLLHRFGVVELPASLSMVSHPAILVIAGVLFLVEFVADKIPWVDSLWDVLHTVVRPLAAAVLAVAGFAEMDPVWRLGAGLLAGGVALTSHGAKASTRAAANASPEPVSNWILSLGEDAVAISLTWLALTHPVATAAVVLVLLVMAILVIRALFRFLKAARRARQARARAS
jgi:Domain of unknown function (DUF4126)